MELFQITPIVNNKGNASEEALVQFFEVVTTEKPLSSLLG